MEKQLINHLRDQGALLEAFAVHKTTEITETKHRSKDLPSATMTELGRDGEWGFYFNSLIYILIDMDIMNFVYLYIIMAYVVTELVCY